MEIQFPEIALGNSDFANLVLFFVHVLPSEEFFVFRPPYPLLEKGLETRVSGGGG